MEESKPPSFWWTLIWIGAMIILFDIGLSLLELFLLTVIYACLISYLHEL